MVHHAHLVHGWSPMDGAIPPEAKRREEAGTEETWAGEGGV